MHLCGVMSLRAHGHSRVSVMNSAMQARQGRLWLCCCAFCNPRQEGGMVERLQQHTSSSLACVLVWAAAATRGARLRAVESVSVLMSMRVAG
jgi:hypothetical protein